MKWHVFRNDFYDNSGHFTLTSDPFTRFTTGEWTITNVNNKIINFRIILPKINFMIVIVSN
jgi:hypothetical protein